MSLALYLLPIWSLLVDRPESSRLSSLFFLLREYGFPAPILAGPVAKSRHAGSHDEPGLRMSWEGEVPMGQVDLVVDVCQGQAARQALQLEDLLYVVHFGQQPLAVRLAGKMRNGYGESATWPRARSPVCG